MNRRIKERPARIKELELLPIGEVLYRLNLSAFDVIIGTNLVIVTSARGTFIHPVGTPEFMFYHCLLNDQGLFTDDEIDQLKELFVIYPTTYFYMLERPSFGSKCITMMMEEVETLLKEATAELAGDPEEVDKYMSSQLIIEESLRRMEAETDALRMQTDSRYVGKVLKKKKKPSTAKPRSKKKEGK